MKKVDDYSKMNELAKKRFIKENFLKQSPDFGSMDETIAESQPIAEQKSPTPLSVVPTSSSAPSGK